MRQSGRDGPGIALAGLSGVAMFVALGMVFLYAPREATMGDVQRIFYFHVASAWVGFFAFLVTFLASAGYLARGERRWDILALSSVEIRLTFITMTVITGSLWARPVWGTYWTWEPRLTISAVQLLIYVAYVMLRAAIESPERKARFSAVYGVVAFVTVPLSWFAIRWWRTIHPDILTGGGGWRSPRAWSTRCSSRWPRSRCSTVRCCGRECAWNGPPMRWPICGFGWRTRGEGTDDREPEARSGSAPGPSPTIR